MKYCKTAKQTAEKNQFCVWNGRKGSKAMILDYSLIANNPIFEEGVKEYIKSNDFSEGHTLDFSSKFGTFFTLEFTSVYINDNCDPSYRIAKIVYAENFADTYTDVGDRNKIDGMFKHSRITAEVK